MKQTKLIILGDNSSLCSFEVFIGMNEKRGREERDESFENVQFECNQANGIFNTTIDSDTDDYDNIRFKLSCINNDNEMLADYDTRKFVCRELHCFAEFSTMTEVSSSRFDCYINN